MNKLRVNPAVCRIIKTTLVWPLSEYCLRFALRLTLALGVCGLASPWMAQAVGTWVQLVNQPPSGSTCYMNLLSDGTVMAQDIRSGAKNWYRLTPDAHGSYLNGTWSTLTPMHDGRNAYASQVLTDGRVFVAGGESGGGNGSAEIYDPLLDTWTYCAGTGFGVQFYDNISEILPNGNVLISPVQPASPGLTMVYNPSLNSWISSPPLYRGYNQDEASWVKLPDNSILTVDPYGTNSERFIPFLNKWINDAILPVAVYDVRNLEIGAALLLPNGKAIVLGATGNTALYTPSGTTNMGSWHAGALIPAGQGAIDAPAAVMPNGKVLCMFSTAPSYGPPCTFYEYDPIANNFTQTTFPGNSSNYYPNDARMLILPDGTVLFSNNGFGPVYAYQPDGSPLPAGQPTIKSITTNAYRSYHLTGTLLNGLNEGAGYGDDAQMNSNYPLVRMTNNATGKVYYARTYNWSSTGVMTGTNIVSTEFMVPENLPSGNYSLVVVANGIGSAPVSFAFNPDPLGITILAGFASDGPIGGPFNPAYQAYFLNNRGTSTLSWSLVNTSLWLNVSPVGGALVPGGQSTVIASVSSAATNLPVGIYTATVWFTNLSSGAAQSIPFTLQVNPFIQNGGFETGSFGDWTLSGNAGSSYVAASTNANINNPSYAHSGYFSAFLGMDANWGYLSQTVQTTPGQSYLLSLFVNSPSGTGSSNEFAVSWDGITVFDQQEFTTVGWTNLEYVVEATSDSTELEFSYENATNFFRLDDVALTNLPPSLSIAAQPTSQVIPAGASADLSVLVGGTPPFTYQWQKNGTNLINGGDISGSDTANLSVNNAVVADSGIYTVVVDSGSLSVTSLVATLTVAGISPNCAVSAPEGLISWWTGNYTANDLVGTNNGTLQNGTSYATGLGGYAFSLNGVNQYVAVPDSPSLSIPTGSPYSLEAWVYRTQNYLPFHVLGKRIDGGSDNYQMGYDGSSPNVPLNAWTHLVDTYDGSLYYLRYYNGALVQTIQDSPASFTTNNAVFRIGESADFAVFPGLIENVRIYNRALSATEIQAIYMAGSNGMCAPTPLMFAGAPNFNKTNGVILNTSLRSGQSYHIQANTDLATTNWIVLTNFIAGTVPVVSFTNKAATNIPQQFYRIVSP